MLAEQTSKTSWKKGKSIDGKENEPKSEKFKNLH